VVEVLWGTRVNPGVPLATSMPHFGGADALRQGSTCLRRAPAAARDDVNRSEARRLLNEEGTASGITVPTAIDPPLGLEEAGSSLC